MIHPPSAVVRSRLDLEANLLLCTNFLMSSISVYDVPNVCYPRRSCPLDSVGQLTTTLCGESPFSCPTTFMGEELLFLCMLEWRRRRRDSLRETEEEDDRLSRHFEGHSSMIL